VRKPGRLAAIDDRVQAIDPEAIYAVVAPRPMLMLSGDQHGGAPMDGIEVLENKLATVYRLHGKQDHFRRVIDRNTATSTCRK
jgi:hypothetical protein